MAFPGLAAYTATKFALEGLAESLAAEAGPLGVKVTIHEGRTDLTRYGPFAVSGVVERPPVVPAYS
jgi:NAD(P)-dependent dehydrogenase (short-subunit alcohol dehydrogenase family)